MRSIHDLIQGEGIDVNVNSSTEFDSGGEISVCDAVSISVVISIRSFLGDGSHGRGSLIASGDDGAHEFQCSLGRR